MKLNSGEGPTLHFNAGAGCLCCPPCPSAQSWGIFPALHTFPLVSQPSRLHMAVNVFLICFCTLQCLSGGIFPTVDLQSCQPAFQQPGQLLWLPVEEKPRPFPELEGAVTDTLLRLDPRVSLRPTAHLSQISLSTYPHRNGFKEPGKMLLSFR